jgi:hypothetical protein
MKFCLVWLRIKNCNINNFRYTRKTLLSLYSVISRGIGLSGNRGGLVRVTTRLRDGQLTNLVSIPGMGNRFFSSPKYPHRLWASPSIVFNGYRGSRSVGIQRPGRGTDLIVTRLRMSGAIPPLPYMPLWCVRRLYLRFTVHTTVVSAVGFGTCFSASRFSVGISWDKNITCVILR